MRDVTTETNKVVTGKSPAASSHKAQAYNLISPRFLRRLAKRLTVGGEKYGSVQWRQGINDADYVTDRFNHFFEHLLKFMEAGNTQDDNLGAMIWGLHCLADVEELAPEALAKVIGTCNLFGETATKVHEAEKKDREEPEDFGRGTTQTITRQDYEQALASSQIPERKSLLSFLKG
jgi:hypothetical protein